MWEGSLHNGRPALNLRYVLRYIYEQERGPIPPGMTLWRTDHRSDCDMETCRHLLCVNPYHVRLLPRTNGLYRRPQEWDGTTTDHTLHYLRKQRARKKEKNGGNGDSQGRDADEGSGTPEGLRVAEEDVGEPRSPRNP